MAERAQVDSLQPVPIGPDGKPWHGAVCRLCNAPINYAWARRAPEPGVCGRCHDQRRRRARPKRNPRAPKPASERAHFERPARSEPTRTRARALLLFALGIAVGFGAALAMAVYAEAPFYELTRLLPAP